MTVRFALAAEGRRMSDFRLPEAAASGPFNKGASGPLPTLVMSAANDGFEPLLTVTRFKLFAVAASTAVQ
jgi:L-cysteine desulfidase